MKYIILHIILFLLVSINNLKAQINLVLNYSFEQYSTCPQGMSFLSPSCIYWYTPISKMINQPPSPFSDYNGGSSDYFNKCSQNTNSSVPLNFVGNQFAKSGVAFSGILIAASPPLSTNNFKEYIETTLSKELISNKMYCIEFYYSIAEFGNNILNSYMPLEIGALITDTVVYRLSGIGTGQPQNINTTPQISQKLPESKDTLNWIKVSGSFIAQGGEQYLTIGNFQNTDTLTNKSIYVYIDDVKLYYCGPDTTHQSADSLIIPNIITPNGDGINDKFIYKNQEQWEFETRVFNRWEVPVFDNHNSKNWDGTFNGVKVSPGVYFYIVKAQAIKTGEIRIYKGAVTVMY